MEAKEKFKTGSRQSAGFTLVELMIVIVIMVILAAAAVPVFTGYVERAREGICITNLSSVSQWLVVENLMDAKLDETKAQENLDKEIGGKKLCPSGGKYIVGDSSGNLVVYCDVHGKTPPQVVGDHIEDLMASGNSFRDTIDKYFKEKATNTLDSTGPNFGGGLKQEIAKNLNIANAFEFCVYFDKNKPGSNYEIYIFDPVGGIENNNKVVEATKYTVDRSGKLVKDTGVKNPSKGTGKLLKKNVVSGATNKPVDFLVFNTSTFQAVE